MSALSLAGMGALLAWAGLPLLYLAARRGPEVAAASRFRTLLVALTLGAALFAVPAARSFVTAHLPSEAAVAPGPSWAAAGQVVVQIARATAEPFAILGAIWMLMVFWAVARLCARTVYTAWLSQGREPVPPAVIEHTELLARELGIAPPRLAVSFRAALPFVQALPTATVVLPQALVGALGEPERALVLRHELTHLARGDHLTALLIELLKVPFAFHPIAMRLCRELGLAREMAVDARLGAVAPRAYAHLLVDVAELHRFGPREAGEVALDPHSLERRIDMLTRPLPHRAAALAPVLLLALGLFGAGVLLPAARADESNRTSDRFEELHVALGAKKTITVTDPAKIAIQDPTIADVRPLNGSDIEISGLTKGRTTMLVWTKADKRFEYQIIVE